MCNLKLWDVLLIIKINGEDYFPVLHSEKWKIEDKTFVWEKDNKASV